MDYPVTEHRSRRRSLGRFVAAVCAAGALLSAGIVSTSTAGAATVHQNFSLTGSMTIGTQAPIEFPAGSGYAADIDSTTGAITNGMLTIPPFSIEPVPGLTVPVTITNSGSGTGTLDPDTGEATVTSSFNVTVDLGALAAGASCTLGPVNVTAKTSNPDGSPFAGNPATGILTATGFTVPALSESATCPPNLVTIANGVLGLPSTATALTMTLTKTAAPPTPPTPTTRAPTPTTVAPASVATVQKPTFTG